MVDAANIVFGQYLYKIAMICQGQNASIRVVMFCNAQFFGQYISKTAMICQGQCEYSSCHDLQCPMFRPVRV